MHYHVSGVAIDKLSRLKHRRSEQQGIEPVADLREAGERIFFVRLERSYSRVVGRGHELDRVNVDVSRVVVRALVRVFDDAADRHGESVDVRPLEREFPLVDAKDEYPVRVVRVFGRDREFEVSLVHRGLVLLQRAGHVTGPIRRVRFQVLRDDVRVDDLERRYFGLERVERLRLVDAFAPHGGPVVFRQTVDVRRAELDAFPAEAPDLGAPQDDLFATRLRQRQEPELPRALVEVVAVVGHQSPLASPARARHPGLGVFDDAPQVVVRGEVADAEPVPLVLLDRDRRVRAAVHEQVLPVVEGRLRMEEVLVVLSLRRLEVEAALEGHIQNLQIFNGERLDLARLSKLRVVYLDRAIHAATVLHRCGAVMVRMIPVVAREVVLGYEVLVLVAPTSGRHVDQDRVARRHAGDVQSVDM
mmetsp:Transcript_32150/g.99299  ORF Transcript_32150/g.99299 Transcript_32150/m.99299 type:complete len:417 (-) Transcript_32150:525-1775(-)